jgi:nitrogen regulatory protein P-II 1
MKLVKAIFRPEQFIIIKNALEENGFLNMTITPVEGQGELKHISHDHCDSVSAFDLLPRIQIEMVVDSSQVDHLIGTIGETCRTEHVGDGRIYVIPVEKAIRVLNGEILVESPQGGSFGILLPGYTELIATHD